MMGCASRSCQRPGSTPETPTGRAALSRRQSRPRLALGDDMLDAVRAAKHYVSAILAASAGFQIGHGHGPMDHMALLLPQPPAYQPVSGTGQTRLFVGGIRIPLTQGWRGRISHMRQRAPPMHNGH